MSGRLDVMLFGRQVYMEDLILELLVLKDKLIVSEVHSERLGGD